MTLAAAAERLGGVIEDASRGLVGREVAVQLIVLAAVAREHALLVGPPGTAKSEAVRRVARGLGGRYFEYLVGRFTEPTEIFGPVDLKRLREGAVETQTAGMLPEADVAFLDEVFLGSTAILNTLLGVLNERKFRRGHTSLDCPLRVCVGATNSLPDDPLLAAFADRFLIHLFLEPTGDPHLETLLEAGWGLRPSTPGDAATLAALDVAIAAVANVDVTAVRPHLAEVIRTLRNAGIGMSDRRIVKLQKLVAAAAVLDGRSVASGADLWPLVFTIVRPNDQDRARDLLRTTLEASRNAAVGAAAEHASLGPLARAQRLETAAAALVGAVPNDPIERRRWRLKLEAIARELDAAFPHTGPTSMPETLAATRGRIVAQLAEVPLEHAAH
jgi:MoxR-like ATPase